jgi:hypothetical protein
MTVAESCERYMEAARAGLVSTRFGRAKRPVILCRKGKAVEALQRLREIMGKLKLTGRHHPIAPAGPSLFDAKRQSGGPTGLRLVRMKRNREVKAVASASLMRLAVSTMRAPT